MYMFLIAFIAVMVIIFYHLIEWLYANVFKPTMHAHKMAKYTAEDAMKETEKDKTDVYNKLLYAILEAVDTKAKLGHTSFRVDKVYDKPLQSYLRVMLEKRGFTVVIIGNDMSISW